jgi:hypothetical protein
MVAGLVQIIVFDHLIEDHGVEGKITDHMPGYPEWLHPHYSTRRRHGTHTERYKLLDRQQKRPAKKILAQRNICHNFLD